MNHTFLGKPARARCAVPFPIPNSSVMLRQERPCLRKLAILVTSTTTLGLPSGSFPGFCKKWENLMEDQEDSHGVPYILRLSREAGLHRELPPEHASPLRFLHSS